MLRLETPVRTALFATFLSVVAAASADDRSQTYTFTSARTSGAVDRVETKVEVGGELTVVEDSKVKRLKTSVVAELAYHERLLEVPAGKNDFLHGIRYYDHATAVIKIEDGAFQPALRDDRRLIGAELDGSSATLFSPHGPLTREELDLIDLQGSSLVLERLLPDKPVAIGDTWKHSDALVTTLLRLDEISKNDVQSTLSSVKDGAALIELSGKVEGAINGVATEIELKARYQFKLKPGRVTWLGMLIKENRSIGHVGTGLDVVARLQTTVTPAAASPQLTDTALADLPLTATPELTQLVHRSADGQWLFRYDRRWFITGEAADALVLRLIDRGELVAQSNLAALGKIEPKKLVSLDGFQKDIQRALGKRFGQFVKASQRANDAGYRVYRVVAQGEVEELPILWIYHLIADHTGQRISLVFTMEGDLADQFGQADEALTATLQFLQPEIAAQSPAPAKPSAASQTRTSSNPVR
jgi:hypothetical protein